MIKSLIRQETQKIVSIDACELLKALDIDHKKFMIANVGRGFGAVRERGDDSIELTLVERPDLRGQ